MTRYVYVAHDGYPNERVKIGIANNVDQRLKQIRCDLVFAVPCDPDSFAWELEQTIHDQFAYCRLLPRRCEGGTEWFAATPSLTAFVRNVRRLGYWPWGHKPRVLLP